MKWSCGFQLRVRAGPNRGNTYVIDSPVLKVGRAIRPGERVPGWIRLQDDTVSRLHCELFWQDDRNCFRLLHRSSTNSTYVNGEEVQDLEIFDGDLLELGSTTLEIQKADLRWSKAETHSIDEWGSQPEAAVTPQELLSPTSEPTMMKIPGATVPVVHAPSNRRLAIGPQVSYLLSTDELEYPLNGSKVRIGSDAFPRELEKYDAEGQVLPRMRFDTEYEIHDHALSYYNLILMYDEIVQNFKVARVGPRAQKVRVFRKQSGLIWQTELPEGLELPLLEDDHLQVGELVFAYQRKEEPI